MDCGPPGSSVHGIFQARSTGVGCHFLSVGDLPNPRIEPTSPVSPALQAGSLPVLLTYIIRILKVLSLLLV